MYVPNKRRKSLIIEGARTKEYETAIVRLSDRGLVHKVSRVNAAGTPLRANERLEAFIFLRVRHTPMFDVQH